MSTKLRTFNLSLAVGAVALLGAATRSQATITFPANQTPFNAAVGEPVGTLHDVCRFSDQQHKQKNFFSADIDWGDGNVESGVGGVAKVGRRNFVLRRAHQYAACAIYNVSCTIHYDKGAVHETASPPADPDNQAIVTNSVAPAPVITLSEGCPATGVAMTATTPSVLGAAYSWTVRDGGGNDIAFTGGTTNQVSFTSPASGSRLQVTVAEATGGCPLGPLGITYGQIDFADVAVSHPQHEEICAAGAGGFTAGCGSGNFCPDEPIRRNQVALVGLLAKHAFDNPPYDVPTATPPGGGYPDVPDTDDFIDFVDASVDEGWMGVCDGSNDFCPTNAVTRAQLARFSVLMTSLTPPTDPVVNPFDDVLVGDFADEFIEELKIDLTNAGTTLGCNNMSNLFCPTSPATRAHAAHFLVYELGIPIPTP